MAGSSKAPLVKELGEIAILALPVAPVPVTVTLTGLVFKTVASCAIARVVVSTPAPLGAYVPSI